jgi:hypothetical protein
MSSARLRTCYSQLPSNFIQGQVLTRALDIHVPFAYKIWHSGVQPQSSVSAKGRGGVPGACVSTHQHLYNSIVPA